MDTDNDLEAVDFSAINPGMLIRAVNGAGVKIEGRVKEIRGGDIKFGSGSVFVSRAGWKFYKVYDGAEVNRG